MLYWNVIKYIILQLTFFTPLLYKIKIMEKENMKRSENILE